MYMNILLKLNECVFWGITMHPFWVRMILKFLALQPFSTKHQPENPQVETDKNVEA